MPLTQSINGATQSTNDALQPACEPQTIAGNIQETLLPNFNREESTMATKNTDTHLISLTKDVLVDCVRPASCPPVLRNDTKCSTSTDDCSVMMNMHYSSLVSVCPNQPLDNGVDELAGSSLSAFSLGDPICCSTPLAFSATNDASLDDIPVDSQPARSLLTVTPDIEYCQRHRWWSFPPRRHRISNEWDWVSP